MQKLQNVAHNVNKHVLRGSCSLAALCDTRLCQLDIPVAVGVPDKVVELSERDTKLKAFDVVRNFLYQPVAAGQHPLVLDRQFRRQLRLFHILGQIHQNVAGSVPELVRKVARRSYLCNCPAHIVSGAVARYKRKSQCVRTILIYYLQRVNAVAQRLRHLPSKLVAHKSVDKNVLERLLTGVLQRGEYHSRYPERDYIITGNERVCGVEILEILGLVRPAEC